MNLRKQFTKSNKYYKIISKSDERVKNMRENYYRIYALELVACALNDSEPVYPSEEVNWDVFKRFCDRHCISNIIAGKLNQLELQLPDEIKLYFEEIVFHAVAKEARVDIETNDLIDEFEKNNIPHMLLKGSVLKTFYPESYMRSMCDVDILIGRHLDEAMKTMTCKGYDLLERDFLHDCYRKKPFINVELHSSLFDKELSDFYDYFKIGFERATLKPGFEYRYELSKEDFYISVLAHLAKHFKRSGVGIRHLADIYLYIKNFPDLNFDYIRRETEGLNLTKFNDRIVSIAFNWFADGRFNFTDPVESYIITSGVYGSSLNVELNKFLLNKDKGNHFINKLLYLFSVIFPDYAYMCERYPELKNRGILLPFYWIKRIIYTLIKSKGSIKYRLSKVLSSDNSSQKRFDDFN